MTGPRPAGEPAVTCPRCLSERVETVTVAPAGGVWEVRQCTRCWYTWRTTEPAARTTPELFPEEFRLTEQTIEDAPELPAIPPLLDGAPTRAREERSRP